MDAAVGGGVVQRGGQFVPVEVVAGNELMEVGIVAVARVEVTEGDGGRELFGNDGGVGVAIEREGPVGQGLRVLDGVDLVQWAQSEWPSWSCT